MDLGLLSGVFASPWNIFRSLLDIAIVAYIFYRLLGLIKGTRAEQLLKGLIILLAFSVVVSYLQLDMVNWLLEKLWIIFAITLPIVFQPELRRILEQLGRGKFFVSSSSGEKMGIYDVVVKEISEAVRVLARNRVGALIVIGRETGIEEFMDSGTTLDSLVSSGILINIFVPNTPLHDGAVIIKEGRIQKAACFLPLSNNPGIDGQLGTRHRAGLGITEVSDALSIIVSEETGAVSVAREGSLVRFLDAQSLKDLLEEELVVRESRRDSFWRRWAADGRKEPEKKKDMA
ncbi:MAG: TIGR00159 family protein [Firmicutes bacterium HGW-Firmicutes-15]|nr:MAG: TIGR00159 family protein [Firmicutes bacterium HGW-Firmicutes-15]